MKENANKSLGFTVVVTLIIILVVVDIGFAGWYVMSRQKTQMTTSGSEQHKIQLTLSSEKTKVKSGEDVSVKVTAHNNSSKKHIEEFSSGCNDPYVTVVDGPKVKSESVVCTQAFTAVAIPAKDSISWDEIVTADRLQKGTNSLTAEWSSYTNEYTSNTITVDVTD